MMLQAAGVSLLALTWMMSPTVARAQVTPSTAAPAAAPPAQSGAQDGTDAASPDTAEEGIGDIVVTAQKRSQRANSVGETINAFDSETLAARGVQNVADLAKAVPGFTYTPSPFVTPVFTIRGVGVYESGFATSPAVTVYTDEVPLAYPVMQVGVGLDLERVEVLKGPQGTLFGGNSTGGAINYVAAKPTDHLVAGGSATIARFAAVDINGYVSGPLSETMRARLAVGTSQGGAWQRSATRPNDENGDRDFIQGRLLIDWDASDTLSLRLNVNGWRDKGQVQAPQLRYLSPSVLNAALPDAFSKYPGNPNVPADFFSGPVTAANAPRIASNDAREADWAPDWGGNRRNDTFYQLALRATYEFSDSIALTSLTSYARTKQNNFVPLGGTAIAIEDAQTFGHVATFNQELRLSGDTDRVHWVLGADYAHTDASETNRYRLPGVLFSLFDFRGLDAFGLPAQYARLFHAQEGTDYTDQQVDEYAAFGNVDYRITDRLSVQAGLRYTQNDRKAQSCGYDTADGSFNSILTALQYLLGGTGPVVPIPNRVGDSRGTCFILNQNFRPAGEIDNKLDQHNVSWRFGLNYKLPGGVLLYANQSRGYKAGVVAVIGASASSQLDPISQERLDATEVGFKAPIGRIAQLNAAGFYYDYRDKQVRGRVLDPVFGGLEKLINVPRSEIYGAEANLDVRPFPGMTAAVGATYIHSQVRNSFTTVTQDQRLVDVGGSRLPFTPEWTANGDLQYGWSLGSRYHAAIGGSVLYHSRTNSTFSVAADPAEQFRIRSYATLDLRATFGPQDERWTATLFGRNVTDTYYIDGVFRPAPQLLYYTGLPATYGATLAFKLP